MQQPKNIRILFIAGFGPIVPDRAQSRALYGDLLGIRFKEESNGYLHVLSPEGLLIGIAFPPFFRGKAL